MYIEENARKQTKLSFRLPSGLVRLHHVHILLLCSFNSERVLSSALWQPTFSSCLSDLPSIFFCLVVSLSARLSSDWPMDSRRTYKNGIPPWRRRPRGWSSIASHPTYKLTFTRKIQERSSHFILKERAREDCGVQTRITLTTDA